MGRRSGTGPELRQTGAIQPLLDSVHRSGRWALAILISVTAVACAATISAVSGDATATTLVGSIESGSGSTVTVAEMPTGSQLEGSGLEAPTPSVEPIDGTTPPTTSFADTTSSAVAAGPGPSTTVLTRSETSTTSAVDVAPAGAGPAAPPPASTVPPTPAPPPDDDVIGDPVPPLPTNATTPQPVAPTGTPAVYDAGSVEEVWVCDGQPDEPRTGFVFVRNPGDGQQVFIEVSARAWSTEEIVGSLMATQASINDGQVLATGPFDPVTGRGFRVESGDPVDFVITANLLTVTERPDESVPVVWSCRAVATR